MNFSPLFTTARVIRASYQIVSTLILFYYIADRAKNGRKLSRTRRRINHFED